MLICAGVVEFMEKRNEVAGGQTQKEGLNMGLSLKTILEMLDKSG